MTDEKLWDNLFLDILDTSPLSTRGEEAEQARRDRTSVVRDILLYLAIMGPRTRGSIIRHLRLSKKTAKKYLDEFLVSLGFVAVREMDGKRYYSITMRGRTFLIAAVIADMNAWPKISYIEEVAEALRDRGYRVYVNYDIEAPLAALPVDLAVEVSGEENPVPVYIARAHLDALSRYYIAGMVAWLSGGWTLAVLPREFYAYFQRMGLGRCKRVVIEYYTPNGPSTTAAAVEAGLKKLLNQASRGGDSAGGSRRVVRV